MSNKSFTKRIRKTRNDKLVSRTPGHNHFNAKESQSGRQRRRRSQNINFLNKKQIGQFFK